MKFGISTACFYPLETEKSLEKVNECDCKYTELFVNSFTEFDNDFLKEIKEIKNKNNTEILSVHPFTSMLETQFIFGDYPRRFTEGVELYKKIFNFTAETGANISVFHGAMKKYNINAEGYAERYFKLQEIAKSFGVTLAQECVERCKSSSPEFLTELKTYIPNISFVLDLKQARRSNRDYHDFLNSMGKNLIHLHLSDGIKNDSRHDCLPIGEGNTDFETFFKELKEIGFCGNAILELYSSNFKDINQLKTSIKNLTEFDLKTK